MHFFVVIQIISYFLELKCHQKFIFIIKIKVATIILNLVINVVVQIKNLFNTFIIVLLTFIKHFLLIQS